MTASGLPWPAFLAAEAEVTANPVHVYLKRRCYSGYIPGRKIAFNYFICSPEAQKPGWQGGIATQKVFARPESFQIGQIVSR